MTIATRQVTVTTGAGIELTSGTAAVAGQEYDIAIANTDATNPVYIGGTSGVTSATGFRLPAGAVYSQRLKPKEQLFARATGGSVVCGCIESVF